MKYRILLVDDESLAMDLLEEYIKRIPDMCVAGRLDRASAVSPFLAKHPVDLLFLDIQMPGKDGINLLKEIDPRPLTIFTTAHRQYAFEGFDLGVVDYLLKPLKWERFKQAIDKFYAHIRLRESDERLKQSGNISIISGNKKHVIRLSEILFIKASKDYSVIYSEDQRYVLRKSLKSLEQLLLDKEFIRVHKSYLVAEGKIRTLKNGFILIGEHKIPIGRAFSKPFFKNLNGPGH
jgi:DNA-binding LytR/AlgR family response regulator